MILNIYNEPFVELEFLQREFSFDLNYVQSKYDLKAYNNVYYVASSSLENWHNILPESKLQVVFILLGNESYDMNIIRKLDNYKCIKHLFLYNGPRPNSLFNMRTHIAFLSENPKFLFSRRYWKYWVWAFRISQRTRKLIVTKPTTIFPLGYTDRFVHELISLSVISKEHKGSIMDCYLRTSKVPRRHRISFVGQEGNWYRKFLIEQFSEEFQLKSRTYFGFGGSLIESSTNSFTEMTRNSDFVLCPPGEVTNETFRYLESLILGSIPIIPRNTILDHHLGNYISESFETNFRTYKRLFKFLNGLTMDQLSRLHELEMQKRITIRDEIQAQLKALSHN